jgi:LPXTG-motif cell wall-anchored protein
MKKLVTMILVMAITLLSYGVAVFAAPADPVADVMAALRKTAAPTSYFTQVESYLNSISLTSAQAKDLIAYIKQADKVAGKVTSFSQLNSTQDKAIYDLIVASGKILNLTVTYDLKTLRAYDSKHRLVFMINDKMAIKQTGHDYSLGLAGIVLILLAGGSALVIRRKKVLEVQE